jgi:DNA-binding SARP family transcriptional activator
MPPLNGVGLRVSIRLLGRFEVAVDDRLIAAADWRRDRAAALVKLLSLSPAHRIHREQAMATFWPDLDAEAAGANLRKAIHFARRLLGVHDLIEVINDVIVLAPQAELETDAELFEAAAKAALRSGAKNALERAAELYGGVLLPDDVYVDWLDNPRQHLQQCYVDVLRAGELWHRLIALDPTDEQAQCALMQAALDAGNRVEAIRLFKQLRDNLRAELGVGPSAATIALYEKAVALSGADTTTAADRVGASLAWGLVHLQSGEFDKAGEIARQTRDMALGAGLAREVGQASALLGLTANMKAQWPELFRSEFIDWVRTKPAFVQHVFDGHLCLSEFCLCSASGHGQIAESAQELLAVAEDANSSAGKGLASLLLGEVALFSGNLDAAEQWLVQAERFHLEIGAVAGRVLAIERLAEIALERGQKWRAGRLIRRGLAGRKVVAGAASHHSDAGACGASRGNAGRGRGRDLDWRSADVHGRLPALFDGAAHGFRDRVGRGGRARTGRPPLERCRAHCRPLAWRAVGRGTLGGARRAAAGAEKRSQGAGGVR